MNKLLHFRMAILISRVIQGRDSFLADTNLVGIYTRPFAFRTACLNPFHIASTSHLSLHAKSLQNVALILKSAIDFTRPLKLAL